MLNLRLFPCVPLLAGWLAACAQQPVTPAAAADTVNPVLATQHFFQPIYSAMDCELTGHPHEDEVEEHFPALYFFLDRSHDRLITRIELEEAQFNASAAEKVWLFGQMDQDGSGDITPNEYRRFAAEAFARLDVDQDGELTEAEVDMASFRKVAKR